jgi:ribokinase
VCETAAVLSSRPSVAVVGHVEWVEFARVAHVPGAGEVAHAFDSFEEPAGGGAVAAVQLARLAGGAVLFTTLGDDEHGRRSVLRLAELGVEVRASIQAAPTRRALTLVDDAGERTITTFGGRLEPTLEDREDRRRLAAMDGTYFTAGEASALESARAASRVLVASPRARAALGHGVEIDALVLSGEDEIELAASHEFEAATEIVVWTEGARGGRYRQRSGESGRWEPVTPPGAIVDSYGCGDSFAAGLTYGLGSGMALDDALTLAARCGAVCLTGRGPYERQLSAADL